MTDGLGPKSFFACTDLSLNSNLILSYPYSDLFDDKVHSTPAVQQSGYSGHLISQCFIFDCARIRPRNNTLV